VRARAILNPRAGLRARRALDALRGGLPSWGPIDIALTQGPGDATRLAREAAERGDDAVLAVGGDGTVNETAAGLIGSRTALGVIPMGSGNGLARTLGLPLKPEGALNALEHAVVRRMDVGRANGGLFLNVAGAGFDAAVGEDFHHHGRRGGRRGVFTYVRLSAARVLSYVPETYVLRAGDVTFEGKALVIAFVNGRQYGGGAILSPKGRLDDGVFDVALIEAAPAWELLLGAPRLFLGGLESFRPFRLLRCTEAVLEGPVAFPHHRDGEPEPAVSRLEVHIEPLALEVLVPRGIANDVDGPFSPDGHGPAAA
jgi:YegS/Rv2252/BmrU family lipid kinase